MVADWAWNEARGARVGDPRRVRTLVRILCCLAVGKGLSWSKALGHGLRQAGGDLLSCAEIGYQDVLAGHLAATVARCRQQALVIIAQDSSSLNYGRLKKTTGLGDVGNGRGTKGLWAHSALALTPEGVPLGVLHLELWCRPKPRGQRAGRRARAYCQKESARWERGCQAATAWLRPGQRAVVVSDRESDVFGYLMMPRRAGVDLVVRATQPRRCSDGQGGELGRVVELLAEAPVAARFGLEVDGRQRRLELRYRRVRVHSPGHWKAAERRTVPLTVIEVREPHPPLRTPALRWLLWTTRQVKDAAAALAVVGYYQRRWRIETQHAQLKSDGYGTERFRMRTAEALRKAIALNYVVVWRAMHLAYVARETPEIAAVEYFEPEELEVLRRHAQAPLVTVQEAVWEAARLGGWPGYRSSAPPGAETVETGLRKLAAMVEGYRLARPGSCSDTS